MELNEDENTTKKKNSPYCLLTERFSLHLLVGFPLEIAAGMNVGFAVGFIVAGIFQNRDDYSSMYVFATFGNFFAIVIAAFYWKTIADLVSCC